MHGPHPGDVKNKTLPTSGSDTPRRESPDEGTAWYAMVAATGTRKATSINRMVRMSDIVEVPSRCTDGTIGLGMVRHATESVKPIESRASARFAVAVGYAARVP